MYSSYDWTRKDLKTKAKAVLKAAYWRLVLVGLVLGIASGSSGSGGASSTSASSLSQENSSFFDGLESVDLSMIFAIIAIVGFIVAVVVVVSVVVSTFVLAPLEIGCRKFTILVSDNQEQSLGVIGDGFQYGYKNNVKTMFLRGLYTFLWSMLFCIPGIIKSYEYRMIPYILADNPDITCKEAFEMSKKMMSGEKWKTFVLDLSFILWDILAVCTCGILFIFYVNPYVNQTNAELYLVLRNKVRPVENNTEYTDSSYYGSTSY